MKITLIYNNISINDDIIADYRFYCFKVCSKYLDIEISEIEPKIIVPLGYYATKHIFEKNGLREFSKKEFPALIGKIFISENYKIFPLSHPASILYHNEFIFKSLENFSKLKKMERN